MWCWHRIRESETGLCPACRTPYGEDPHQFTALDVEEVLKANKMAQAAAKRERQQANHHHHNHNHSVGGGGGSGSGNSNQPARSHSGDLANSGSMGPSDGGGDPLNGIPMDVPKDRTQLANMRVIRRNLVYAVGLPLHLATEEILRKPEYFGQYGKIAKIVLNRSQPTEGGDPRRASASAYVTFVYKEDTLSCILALDGFYLENRNIRASYGTSKYCSAFIKNVRCNNPDCTYLHEMGATEDTFTKQEIQAGYVTSGRDVLARQQQIVAEQLQQQQQQSSSGAGGFVPPRKRVGNGGPSATGKASTHPVFPPPEFDEQAKPPMLPPPAGIVRSATTQATMSQAQQAAMLNPATISAKLGRSASVGVTGASPTVPQSSAIQAHRKPQSGGGPTTAASVVAGGRKEPVVEIVQPHSALTALTPLKRNSGNNKQNSAFKTPLLEDKLPNVRNGKKQNGAKAAATVLAAVSSHPLPSSIPAVGGDTMEPPSIPIVAGDIGGEECRGGSDGGVGTLGGLSIPMPARPSPPTAALMSGGAASLLGGDVFTGHLPGHRSISGSVIGGSSLLGGTPLVGAPGGDEIGLRNHSGFWSAAAPGPGSSGVIGSHISNNPGNSSSALASLLGINLPTGSGSLHESLWSSAPQQPHGPSPLSALNQSVMMQNPHFRSNNNMPIGGVSSGSLSRSANIGGSSLIGGVPIAGVASSASGSFAGSNTKNSDIALLQSLLPGVHITSDTSVGGFGSMATGWAAPGLPQNVGAVNNSLGGNLLHPQQNWIGGGNGSRVQNDVGAIGQNTQQKQNQRQNHGIW